MSKCGSKIFNEDSLDSNIIKINDKYSHNNENIGINDFNKIIKFIDLYPDHINMISNVINSGTSDSNVAIILRIMDNVNMTRRILFNLIECINFPAINHLDNGLFRGIVILDCTNPHNYSTLQGNLVNIELFEHLIENGCDINTIKGSALYSDIYLKPINDSDELLLDRLLELDFIPDIEKCVSFIITNYICDLFEKYIIHNASNDDINLFRKVYENDSDTLFMLAKKYMDNPDGIPDEIDGKYYEQLNKLVDINGKKILISDLTYMGAFISMEFNLNIIKNIRRNNKFIELLNHTCDRSVN